MEQCGSENNGNPLSLFTDLDVESADVASEHCVISSSAFRGNVASSSEQPSGLVEDIPAKEIPICSQCAKEADQSFCEALFERSGIHGCRDMCRECKSLRLLEEYVEVDKYCYSAWFFSRKRKRLRLRREQDELMICFWPAHRSSSWKISVPVRDIIGVVFGAYTCTFKRQSNQNMPPHWAAFSLVGRHRTYDFAARDPEVVECCVRTFQKAICEKRSEMIERGRLGIPIKDLACPDLGTFDPWPLGFFLWMRLRFRLQDEASKRRLGVDHMLWIVFMKCAFLTSDERSKARFIDMAEQLHRDGTFEPGSTEMRDLSTKIQFQKDREMAIVKDRYECRVDTFLPRAPTAVLGTAQPAKQPPRLSR